MQARARAAGAVVVNAGGEVLLVRRGRPPMAGAWSLPGGRVEADETPEAAVVREVWEETALRVRVIAKIATVALDHEGYAYDIHEYLCSPLGTTPAPSSTPPAPAASPRAGDDATEARWADPSQAAALGVSPAALRIIEEGLRLWRYGAPH